jgi:dipeptidyl aminopeptidase/acylaminoacyl peptidase
VTGAESRTGPPAGDAAAPKAARDGLTIERIVAIDSPRDIRVSPRERAVAWIADGAGARQLFVLSLRGGLPVQVTASEKDVSDPQWSPDGRRLAFVRDDEIWVGELAGGRLTRVEGHAAGTSMPRWSPDGRRLAFQSRRRGWPQVWLVDAPTSRRGRPPNRPTRPQPRAVTPPGLEVEAFEWAPDGKTLALVASRGEDDETRQVIVLDLATGQERIVAGQDAWAAGAQWLPNGDLLFVTDADGWFQVVRTTADGKHARPLTSGEREHGEPSGGYGWAPLPSPDGSRLAHIEVADGLVRLFVTSTAPGSDPSPGQRLDPWDGVWRAVGWLPDGAWIAAVGESESRPPDLWLLPVPGLTAADARPHAVTRSMPAVLEPAFSAARATPGERIAFEARDGLRIEGTLWRPRSATGDPGLTRVATILYPHGGPTAQSFRSWAPIKQLLVREGFAFLDVDFRGSTGYGRTFRHANHDEWGHADAQDMVDAGRWVASQPWSDGRLAIYGGSYGGYLVLCALVEEPSLWSAGVDLFGDSEIAESYRHGDRLGRLDLRRMMGSPDDPARVDLYRRGSPVYRAERIEAPLLILHGRKDRRVVPLMTERMVEALEIEGKHHEVHWYEDEGHGWERRENRRDAFARTVAFLRRHVLDEPAER